MKAKSVRVEAEVDVPLDVRRAFAVSQTTGELRLRWDPFIRRQQFLDGATEAAKGVRTETVSRHGLRMVSEYQAYHPPTQVGMKMVEGPWFFARFGGGWSFRPDGDDACHATWRYTFTVRPAWLGFVANPLGWWLLGRDIRRRIAAFAAACTDPAIISALDAS